MSTSGVTLDMDVDFRFQIQCGQFGCELHCTMRNVHCSIGFSPGFDVVGVEHDDGSLQQMLAVQARLASPNW